METLTAIQPFSSSQISVQDFPHDVLVEIFKRLTFDQWQRIRRVCRRWKQISQDPRLLSGVNVPFSFLLKLNPNPKKSTLHYNVHFCYTFYRNFIIIGTYEGQIQVLNKNTLKEIEKRKAHAAPIDNLIQAKDKLLSVAKNTFTVWKIDHLGEMTYEFSHTLKKRSITSVAFDGTHILFRSHLNGEWPNKVHIFKENEKKIVFSMKDVEIGIYENFGIFIRNEILSFYDLNTNNLQMMDIPKIKSTCPRWTYHLGHVFIFGYDLEKKSHFITAYSLHPEFKKVSSKFVSMEFPNHVYFRSLDEYLLLHEEQKVFILKFSNKQLHSIAKIDTNSDSYKFIAHNLDFFLIEPYQISKAYRNLSNQTGFKKITDCDLKDYFSPDESKLPESYNKSPFTYDWNSLLEMQIYEGALYWAELGFTLNVLDFKEQSKEDSPVL